MSVSEIGVDRQGRPYTILLAAAGKEELLELVRSELRRFSERDVLQAIRHPHVSADVLDEIYSSRTFFSVRLVKRLLAGHPLTPLHAALHCLGDLSWRDLADLAREVRAPIPVRRAANARLLEKVRALTLGEKVSLARIADRELFPRLLEEAEPAILSTLLRNTRLTAEDLVKWISVGRPVASQLALVAQDKEWSRRADVRAALYRNRETPRAIALMLLPTGTRLEWRSLVGDEAVPPLLAACAEELLAAGGRIDRRRSQG